MTDNSVPSGRENNTSLTSGASGSAPSVLLALADRCEREEPGFELRDAIAVAVGYCLHVDCERSGAQSDTGFTCTACGADSWGNRSKNGLNQRLHDKTPNFPESLDAAVTLEDSHFVISVIAQKGTPVLVAWIDQESGVVFKGKARTEALARCAAALHARAALVQS